MSNLMRRFRRLVTPASLAVFLVVGSVGQAAALSGGYPNQSPGNRGVNVKVLQHLLRQHGATIGRFESYVGARIPLNGLLRMLVRMAPAYGKASSQ